MITVPIVFLRRQRCVQFCQLRLRQMSPNQCYPASSCPSSIINVMKKMKTLKQIMIVMTKICMLMMTKKLLWWWQLWSKGAGRVGGVRPWWLLNATFYEVGIFMNEAYDQELDDDDDDGNVALQLSWRSGLADLLLLCILGCTKMSKSCQNHFASWYILVLYICNPFLQKKWFLGHFPRLATCF